jgi:hypothetical protein
MILFILQTAVAMPYRASAYADAYWGTDDAPMQEARRQGLDNAIVFVENHPWEILLTKLHSLGFIMGDAHRLLFLITQEGLDQVLADMGAKPEEVWTIKPDLWDLEQRIYAWNRRHIESGNPPIDPWAEEGYYTYFSNGALHLVPENRELDVILARDLSAHNQVLMDLHPRRACYRYHWDQNNRRFILTRINSAATP